MERTLAQLFRGYNQGYNLEPANTINEYVYLSTLDRVTHQGYNLDPTNTIKGWAYRTTLDRVTPQGYNLEPVSRMSESCPRKYAYWILSVQIQLLTIRS